MDDSILLLESILEEVRKLNSKIEDVCAINKSGTVFQGIYRRTLRHQRRVK